MKEPRIEFWQSKKDNEWYFRIKAGNGRTVGHGGGLKFLANCMAYISNLQKRSVFDLWQSEADGQWYFNAKAPGGEVLAQSEGYTRKYGCQRGIKAFKNIVKDAPVIRAVR